MAGQATFAVPSGYEMLVPPDSATFLKLNGNLVSDADNGVYILQSRDPHSGWFAGLRYEDVGHIADSDHIDADALLATMQKDSDADNDARKQQGLATMDLTGWAIKPSYDRQTHRVEWAYNFQNADGSATVNWDTRLLGRTGDMTVIVADDPSALAADIPDFNKAITGFAFNPGQTYGDYKQGDKLATYGLMGLIAGGTAAAVVKTGLLAGLLGVLVTGGKAVLLAVVGGMTAFRTFFSKRFRKKQG